MAMPFMTGWDFLCAHQQDARLAAIPVVVMTALAPLPHPKLPPAVIAFLEKPIDLDELEHLLWSRCQPELQTRAFGM
jgi:CheY-like chemotaxis protein